MARANFDLFQKSQRRGRIQMHLQGALISHGPQEALQLTTGEGDTAMGGLTPRTWRLGTPLMLAATSTIVMGGCMSTRRMEQVSELAAGNRIESAIFAPGLLLRCANKRLHWRS